MRVKCFQEVKNVYVRQRLTYSVKSYELKYKQRQLKISFNYELTFHPFISEAKTSVVLNELRCFHENRTRHMRFLMIIPHSTHRNCLPTHGRLLVKGCLQVRRLSLRASSIWGRVEDRGVVALGGGLVIGVCSQNSLPRPRLWVL